MALQTLSMQIEGPADAAILELFDLQPADRAYLEARRRPGWEAFEAVARLDPKHPPARRALATMAADLGRWKEARWRFETLVSEFPRDADARHRFAFAAWNNGEEDLALEQWAAAVEATPGHADSWYGIGTAWLGKGLWESAEKALTKAVDLDPLNWRAREALIQAHVGLGRFAKAQADRDVLRRLSPKLPRVGDRIVVAVLPREGGALLVREGLQESAGWAFRAERFSQAPPGGKPIHVTELRRAGDGFELGDVADDGTFSAKKTLPAGSDLERFLEEVKR
jgi:tetratricopeptide (TPR) repeat protein